jgi:hypothetical protein
MSKPRPNFLPVDVHEKELHSRIASISKDFDDPDMANKVERLTGAICKQIKLKLGWSIIESKVSLDGYTDQFDEKIRQVRDDYRPDEQEQGIDGDTADIVFAMARFINRKLNFELSMDYDFNEGTNIWEYLDDPDLSRDFIALQTYTFILGAVKDFLFHCGIKPKTLEGILIQGAQPNLSRQSKVKLKMALPCLVFLYPYCVHIFNEVIKALITGRHASFTRFIKTFSAFVKYRENFINFMRSSQGVHLQSIYGLPGAEFDYVAGDPYSDFIKILIGKLENLDEEQFLALRLPADEASIYENCTHNIQASYATLIKSQQTYQADMDAKRKRGTVKNETARQCHFEIPPSELEDLKKWINDDLVRMEGKMLHLFIELQSFVNILFDENEDDVLRKFAYERICFFKRNLTEGLKASGKMGFRLRASSDEIAESIALSLPDPEIEPLLNDKIKELNAALINLEIELIGIESEMHSITVSNMDQSKIAEDKSDETERMKEIKEAEAVLNDSRNEEAEARLALFRAITRNDEIGKIRAHFEKVSLCEQSVENRHGIIDELSYRPGPQGSSRLSALTVRANQIYRKKEQAVTTIKKLLSE